MPITKITTIINKINPQNLKIAITFIRFQKQKNVSCLKF